MLPNPLTWKTRLPIKEITSIDDILKLGKKLGKGSFGTVYAGTIVKDGKQIQVAIKEQNLKGASAHRLEGLQTEIEALYGARKCSNFISRLYDILYDTQNQKLYFVIDRIQGVDLDTYVFGPDRNKPIRNPVQSDADAMKILLPLMKGIECMHSNRIAHRDIKLANAMIDTSVSDNATVKWIDFGLSCINICAPGTLGTASTMAPEVMTKTVKPDKWRNTDLWSFGCMMYTLITQQRYAFQTQMVTLYKEHKKATTPEEQNSIRAKMIHLVQATAPGAELPHLVEASFPRVSKVLRACLIVDPDERARAWKRLTKK